MGRQLTLRPSATGLSNWPWRVNLPANISSSGKRERRFFSTKQKAETFCRQQRIRLDNFGRNASTLTPGQLEQAALAFERLAPFGVELNAAVADFIARHVAKQKSVTFAELFHRFTESRKHKSAAYLRALKYTFPRFPNLHDQIVADLSPQDVEGELEGMTPFARNGFLRNLRAVFNFGVKRGWLKENPIAKLDFATIKRGEVVTLTPNQAASLMNAAAKDHALLPYNALGLFSGMRPKELQRLHWEQIDLVEGHIEVTPQVSKTGRRRIIDIEPNLKGWLNYYISNGGSPTAGSVTPLTNLPANLSKIRHAAGIDRWPQDVMRHSYASYWLAEYADINRLTLQMGHENADMLWRHYHRAAKRKDAAAYWQIMPSADADAKVVSISAAG